MRSVRYSTGGDTTWQSPVTSGQSARRLLAKGTLRGRFVCDDIEFVIYLNPPSG